MVNCENFTSDQIQDGGRPNCYIGRSQVAMIRNCHIFWLLLCLNGIISVDYVSGLDIKFCKLKCEPLYGKRGGM